MDYTTYKKNRRYIKKIPLLLEPKIAIIVPFRESGDGTRTKQLNEFIKYYNDYIPNLNILIIEQSNDGKKFNRGKVLNVGFDIANKSQLSEMFIFHDVDLISPPELKKVYSRYTIIPIHIASLWKEKYNFGAFLGGIISFNKETYEKINGFPNNFYGWGGEDDAMYNRLATNSIDVYSLVTKEGIEIKEQPNSKNDEGINKQKTTNILNDLKVWKKDGLSSLKYEVLNIENMGYENVNKITVSI